MVPVPVTEGPSTKLETYPGRHEVTERSFSEIRKVILVLSGFNLIYGMEYEVLRFAITVADCYRTW